VRSRGRANDALRSIDFELGFTRYAEGSVLCSFGQTKVLCNASVDESVPPFLFGKGKGWVTAEYAMLPRATHSRSFREAKRGRQGGRTLEIQRLIGRSIRGVCDLKLLGERTVVIDCDVLQADGGTRTASITGAYVALALAVRKMMKQGLLKKDPLIEQVAAVSVGIVDGLPLLDLDYAEDSEADVDCNVVMTGAGHLIEIQGTGEKRAFTRSELQSMLDLAQSGIDQLRSFQREVLEQS